MKRLGLSAAVIVGAAMAIMAGQPHHPSPGRADRTRGTARTRLSPEVEYDTVRDAAVDSVTVAGFEKAQSASRESMFVTNGSSRPFAIIGLEICYLDMQGRMLHKAEHAVAEVIPAGETRMVSVPSFDRQNLFYYRLSPMSRCARQATPFDVRVVVKYICYPKLKL